MNSCLLQAHDADPQRVRRQTTDALELLFGVQVMIPRRAPPDLLQFVQASGRELERAADAALLAFLAPHRRRPGPSVVRALAEILFVPRPLRTEYIQHQLPTEPWDIRRLLLEYALWSAQIDPLLGALTKGYCARRCHRAPAGCCTTLGYDLGLVPEAMLQAQQLEAQASGWSPPAQEYKCKYHGPRGCCLRLFKSPACNGMLCDPLIEHLQKTCDPTKLQAFFTPLASYRNQPLSRTKIFTTMSQLVQAGQHVIDKT